MIVMVPENPDSRIEVIRRDQSDSDGSFTLPAVIPGTYTVVAVEDGWALEWSRREVLARYLPHGQKVTVGAEARAITLSEPVEVQ